VAEVVAALDALRQIRAEGEALPEEIEALRPLVDLRIPEGYIELRTGHGHRLLRTKARLTWIELDPGGLGENGKFEAIFCLTEIRPDPFSHSQEPMPRKREGLEERNQQILADAERGMTTRELATKYDLSKTTIDRIRRALKD
jgi:hypothetical protein